MIVPTEDYCYEMRVCQQPTPLTKYPRTARLPPPAARRPPFTRQTHTDQSPTDFDNTTFQSIFKSF